MRGQTRHLTIDTNGTTGTIQFGGLVGNTVALGAIGITGNLDLDANIVGAASLAVSGTSLTSVPMSPPPVHKPIPGR